MIYHSNLTCPDLQPFFEHVECRPMPHSRGHSVLSDWSDKSDDDERFAIYRRCGFWTHDEAAILYNCVKQVGGRWIDIGSHTGWTTSHIAEAGASSVIAVDHLYPPRCAHSEYIDRFWLNVRSVGCQGRVSAFGGLSSEFFDQYSSTANGVVIDGDHDAPRPLEDAQNADRVIGESGVILLHDHKGKPVRDASAWLVENGWQRKVYHTPHVVAVCWKGDFVPPEHTPDPNMK